MIIINHSFKTYVLYFYLNLLDNTEKKILNAATTLFQRKGYSGAKMEALASEAGVNKALLNYYYRSKERLFQKVFENSIREFLQKVLSLLGGELPLDMKVYKAVDLYTRMLLEHPDLPIFIISEIRHFPDHIGEFIRKPMATTLQVLDEQLAEAHKKGLIREISAFTFFMNLLGLTVFPFIISPLTTHLFKMQGDDFKNEILKRKQQLPNMIIQTMRP